jgi:hypothetical protein
MCLCVCVCVCVFVCVCVCVCLCVCFTCWANCKSFGNEHGRVELNRLESASSRSLQCNDYSVTLQYNKCYTVTTFSYNGNYYNCFGNCINNRNGYCNGPCRVTTIALQSNIRGIIE